MATIAVFVNDAAHARKWLPTALRDHDDRDLWVLVACPPRLTRRVGRFASQSCRARWREQWCARLTDELVPLFERRPRIQLSDAPLLDLVRHLELQHGPSVEVLDLRRPRLGAVDDTVGPPTRTPARQWAMGMAVASGLSLALALSD